VAAGYVRSAQGLAQVPNRLEEGKAAMSKTTDKLRMAWMKADSVHETAAEAEQTAREAMDTAWEAYHAALRKEQALQGAQT